MKEIYSLKYPKTQDIFIDKFIKDNLKEESDIILAIDDFINNNYDIVSNKTVALTSRDNKIYLYILSGDIKSLYIKFDKDNIELTDLGKQAFKDENFLNNALSEIYFCIYFIYNLRKIEKTKFVKSIKSKFYEKLKVKGSNIEVFKYEKTEDKKYIVDKDKNKATFLVNNYKKTTITVPSTLYPLPNKNDIQIFNRDNTVELENEDISKILSSVTFTPGFCYKNADTIINKIKEANLDYKLDFYSGWIYGLENMTHHAWVVVNDKHILDVAFFRGDDIYDEFIKKSEKGEIGEINRELVSDNVVNFVKQKIDFKEKYGYGKILNNYLYIGVKTNSMEARTSFNSLLKKYPDHPNYRNLNKTNRSNKTLDLIYKKL